ncbi:MAG: peptidylprolyl isomerase [Saprospiraceae bacterium]|nr:peptidylprolyl isomerase [Saprospiraceae bacterium]HRG68403.1 peptidylprolyl isomerase [Saprospiraceae bacterium]
MNRFFLLIVTALLASSCSKTKTVFSLEGNQVKLPSKALFVNNSQESDRWEWDFGDGTRSTEKNPKHLYVKSGIYQVVLKSFHGKKMNQMQQKIEVLPPDGCYVLIETSLGNMIAKLYDQTPLHRDNFNKHAEQGYYNDLLFHRVINGFMIQGGDPQSKNAESGAMLGSGGPGYTIPAEFNRAFIHKKGAIAAARTGDQVNPKKESSGSQFYIVQGSLQTDQALNQMEDRKGIKYSEEQRTAYKTLGGTPFLDMEYTVFGEIIEGLDVIDKIASVKTERGDRPSQNVTMKIRSLH